MDWKIDKSRHIEQDTVVFKVIAIWLKLLETDIKTFVWNALARELL